MRALIASLMLAAVSGCAAKDNTVLYKRVSHAVVIVPGGEIDACALQNLNNACLESVLEAQSAGKHAVVLCK